MEKKFSNNEILEAVDFFLKDKFEKNLSPKKKEKVDPIPKDTEEIILQAEKYLKKN